MSDILTIVSQIPVKYRHLTNQQILDKLKTAEKAAVLFFFPPEDIPNGDPVLTSFFVNGYMFLKEAQLAILWKMKAGAVFEKNATLPLFNMCCEILAQYYTGFE